MKLQAPIRFMNEAINSGILDASELKMDALENFGMYVLRRAIDIKTIERYYLEYKNYQNSDHFNRTNFHLTEVGVGDQNPLREILRNDQLLKLFAKFFLGNVGLYNFRIVKKDSEDFSPVFLHQDIGYHKGGFERYSLFIPLTRCWVGNGGLKLYPGTHKFGYLGDVGEIRDFLPADYPRLTPDLFPGDILFMHSALWHSSGENLSREERVYLDVHIQDANEPSNAEVLSGKSERQWVLNLSHDEIFSNSRSQKLKELYQKIQQ